MNVFDEYAEKYDLWYEKPFGSSAYKLEVECLKKLYKQSKNSLEVGVGSGRFAFALGVRYGVDSSKELLKKAIARGVYGVLGKAEALPFKDKVFDEVLIVVSLCFFENPVLSLKESNRVLKDDGFLLLSLVLSESPWAVFYKEKAKKGHPLYKRANFYSYDQLVSMLKRVFQKYFPLDRLPT